MPFPAIGAGAGALGGALIGAAGSIFSGSQAADFAERSYKHRYQWQVKDLKKAGLNPMLAVGATPPNVPQPNFPNIGEGALKGGQAAFSAIQAKKLQEEQLYLMRAQGNKEIAQGDLADAQKKQIMEILPFAAKDAAAKIASTEAIADKTRMEIMNLDIERLRKMNDYEQEQALYPLILQKQQYDNQAAALGMSQKEADSKWYEAMGSSDKYGPALKFILQLLDKYSRP